VVAASSTAHHLRDVDNEWIAQERSSVVLVVVVRDEEEAVRITRTRSTARGAIWTKGVTRAMP
jgi:hypothetical protein